MEEMLCLEGVTSFGCVMYRELPRECLELSMGAEALGTHFVAHTYPLH